MLDGSEESKIKLILMDLISESILNLNYQMANLIKVDGVDHKPMGQDLDLVL